MSLIRPSSMSSQVLLRSAVVYLLLACTGCQIGPQSLKVANSHYSDAVRVATSEQMLVNLVRLRYRDQPVFLGISSISTQFEFGVDGDISGTIPEGGANILGLGAGVDYAERPTITFSILGGEEFQRKMLAPLEVVVVALLAEAGWRGDRILRLTVEGLNGLQNAPRASGPTPSSVPEYQAFLETVSLLHELSTERLIEFEYETRRETISDPIPLARIDGSDVVDAALVGVEFEVSDGGETAGLIVEKRRLVMRFADEAEQSPDVARLRQMLNLDPARRRVDLVNREDSDFDPFEPERQLTELGIDTRSLMGVMYYLSNAVEPPPEHVEAGVVTNTVDAAGRPFDWNDLLDGLFEVHSSRKRPDNASVAVRHRGHWFYIDDSDETSKSTFLLLSQIFALQAGEIEEVKPVLTLPVG